MFKYLLFLFALATCRSNPSEQASGTYVQKETVLLLGEHGQYQLKIGKTWATLSGTYYFTDDLLTLAIEEEDYQPYRITPLSGIPVEGYKFTVIGKGFRYLANSSWRIEQNGTVVAEGQTDENGLIRFDQYEEGTLYIDGGIGLWEPVAIDLSILTGSVFRIEIQRKEFRESFEQFKFLQHEDTLIGLPPVAHWRLHKKAN